MEQGVEIAHPLADTEWGVRRFMLREPSGTIKPPRFPSGSARWTYPNENF